jgi:DNA-binding NtrC family response regulator
MSQKKSILLVDDDQLILTSTRMILELEGYSVDLAENGREAVDKSNTRFYNLAIVDWRLPDIEGTTLLLQLKETNPRMSMIMLTGYPSKENSELAIRNGAKAFIIKPVDFDFLLNKINETLKKQEESLVSSQEEVKIFVATKTVEAEQCK